MRGALHHLELWVPDLTRATESLGWLLEALGYAAYQDWPKGRSWRLHDMYVVLEQSPAMTEGIHERRRPGLNHVAFHVGEPEHLDELISEAKHHGWMLMFGDSHPHAGGPDHHAGYLENVDGFEVELVAQSATSDSKS